MYTWDSNLNSESHQPLEVVNSLGDVRRLDKVHSPTITRGTAGTKCCERSSRRGAVVRTF